MNEQEQDIENMRRVLMLTQKPRQVVHNSEELEIIGKPAIVKLKSVGQQSWTFNDKKEQS